MSETAAHNVAAPALIGPGRLVLLVGPSGAGKDTILSRAKAACAADETIVFARRVVTRPQDGHEDHDSVDALQFSAAERNGAFALSWHAHGLSYGIPAVINADIRAARTVVCNVSRGVVTEARTRYAHVTCVLITAKAEVLAARLAARARASDASLHDRIARSGVYPDFSADVVIDNDGLVEDAVRMLFGVLKNPCAA